MATKHLAAALSSVLVCFNISSCGGSGNSTGAAAGGGSTSPTEVLYTTGGVNLLAFKVDPSNANLTLTQTVQTGGNTFLAADNPPIVVSSSAGEFLYILNPLATGINAYSMGSDGSLTAVAGSPFLVPQNVISSPVLGGLMSGGGGKYLYALDQSGRILESQIDSSTGAVTFGSTSSSSGFLVGGAAIDPSGASIYISDGIAGFTSTGNYAGVSGYSVNSSTGQVSSIAGSPFPLAANSQPCEVVVDPSGHFVYTSLDNADAIAGFARDSVTGALTMIAGSPFPTSRTASQTCHLAIHPSGKFLYALNLNGHDISGYSIDSNSGALTPLPGSPFPAQNTPDVFHQPFTQGPMAMDPSGKFLYVLTSEPYVAVYSVNPNSGTLSISGSPRPVPEPIYSLAVFQLK